MVDEDWAVLKESVTELGKDFVADWAVGAATTVVVGAAVGTLIPGAGNLTGAVGGGVVNTINTGKKIIKAPKYINTGKKIAEVSKRIISKSEPDIFKESAKWLKNSKGKNNPFSNSAEVNANNVNISPVKETLNNMKSSAKKSWENISDWCKEVWESGMRGAGKTSTEYMESNTTSLSDKFGKIQDMKMYPKEF